MLISPNPWWLIKVIFPSPRKWLYAPLTSKVTVQFWASVMDVLMGSRSGLHCRPAKVTHGAALESNIDECEVNSHASLGDRGWWREGGENHASVATLLTEATRMWKLQVEKKLMEITNTDRIHCFRGCWRPEWGSRWWVAVTRETCNNIALRMVMGPKEFPGSFWSLVPLISAFVLRRVHM